MSFDDLWETIKGRRSRKTLSTSIPPDRVHGEPLAPPPDPGDLGYFQVRLAEMFLRDARVFLSEWAPATLFMCEFIYARQNVRSPFFVSNQLLDGLAAAGQGIGNTGVRFRGTRIVGPVPYAGDEVAVFAGLFRTKTLDLRKSLFAIFDKLFGVIDVAALGTYLKIADKLTEEVMKSFGMSDVECLLAERNVFGTPQLAMQDRYFVMLNIDERSFDRSTLHVVDGTLQWQSGDRLVPFDLCDYCLIRIEMVPSRTDFTQLPFDRTFDDALAQLAGGRSADAKALLIKCLQEVATSDDLSKAHRYRLSEYYQVTFLKDQERYSRLRVEPENAATRGSTRGDAGAVTAELEIKQMRKRIDLHPELRKSSEAIAQIERQLRSEMIDSALHREADREKEIADYLVDHGNDARRVSAQELVQALVTGTLAQ